MCSPCVLCNGTTQLKMQQRNFDIFSCVNCGHWFIDPAVLTNHLNETYGDDYFFGGKDGYSDYLAGAEQLIARGQKYAQRVQKHTSPGNMLDVGAAAGFLAKGFAQEGWDVTAIEPNKSMVEYGRENLGINISEGNLESCDTDIKFDLVSLIQVIAHVQNLPQALDRLEQITTPDGYVLIETWNRDSLTAKLCGKRWHELTPPSVLHWFSKESLQKTMQLHGFEQVAGASTTKWISLQHAASLIGHSLENQTVERLSRKLPAGWTIPYLGNDLFWALFKKVQ